MVRGASCSRRAEISLRSESVRPCPDPTVSLAKPLSDTREELRGANRKEVLPCFPFSVGSTQFTRTCSGLS